jgi:hypothetical protein
MPRGDALVGNYVAIHQNLLILEAFVHVIRTHCHAARGEVLEETRNSSTAKTEKKVQGALLRDIVVLQRVTIFQLLPGKDETLLVRRNAFPLLDLRLRRQNRVTSINVKRNRPPRQRLHKDLDSATASAVGTVMTTLLSGTLTTIPIPIPAATPITIPDTTLIPIPDTTQITILETTLITIPHTTPIPEPRIEIEGPFESFSFFLFVGAISALRLCCRCRNITLKNKNQAVQTCQTVNHA